MTETQRNIKRYKAALPGLRERIVAAGMLLVVSMSMMVSASLAWYTISTAPEVSAINTTIAANGNLEIALVGKFDEEGNVLAPDITKEGDSSAADGQTLVGSNITWGNLVNLSDHSYGLNEISLRPALLSGYNLNSTPLYGATYASDGRIVDVSQIYEYATWTPLGDDKYYFAAGKDSKPGVRAIASVTYTNASGDAARERLQKDIINAYADANAAYVDMITGVTMVDDGVSCMDALLMLMEIYVNEKADNVLDTSGTTLYSDYSGVVTYMYRLIQEFEKVLLEEGEALLTMANMQMYLQDETNTVGTEYFKSLDELLAKTDAQLKNLGVNLESYATYRSNRTAITSAMNDAPGGGKSLKELAELYDPSPSNTTRPTEIVKWSQISTAVNKLVDIGSTEINGLPMSSFNGSNIGEVLGILNAKSHTVVIQKGALKDTEQRLKNHLQEKDVRVAVYVKALDKKIENALVTTAAVAPFLSNNDQATTFNLKASGNSGDATAQDTYGMAIDLWVRTNMTGTKLMLEGGFRYSKTKEPVTCVDLNGNTANLYDLVRSENPVELYYKTETMTDEESGETAEVRVWYDATTDARFATDMELADEDYMDPSVKQDEAGNTETKTLSDGTVVNIYTSKRCPLSYEAYQLKETVDGAEVVNWYNSITHMLIGTDDELREDGYSIVLQEYYPVIGYEGPNRIWMDWEELIEAGYMPEDSTTQGAGSCYVFYADPSEQTRILELLKAFSVAFIDAEGTHLASARLDTANAYAINGKVTVPLVMSSGVTYEDEEGGEHIGITELTQNEATRITAIIYLDGMQLTNEQVLAANEIEGRLNFQFGSSAALEVGNDRELQAKYRTMTATATAEDGRTSTKDTERITYEYDGVTKKINVTVTVDGDQPNNMSAFFIRAIGTSQGSKMESVDFIDNKNGTWSAEFELTKPGLYSLRSVIADGVEYDLQDHPTVFIEGLNITSISCPGFSSGMIMTADSYLDVPVEAVIDADESLMPSNVRALFRDEDGKEYTALMSYDKINHKWTGTARITSSGTVTLRYLVMDGDPNEIPANQSITLITKLGLKANIWCTNGDELPVEFTGNVDVGVKMKIVDDSKAEIEALENVWLYYHRDDSSTDQDGMDGAMTWNNSTGYYEGTMTMESAGNYVFNRLVIVNDGVASGIYRADAPTFTVMPSEPPVMDAENIYEVEPYQFTAGKATATMGVNLKNAQTATVWGLIENQNGTGQKTWVQCTTKSAYGNAADNTATYFFTVPTNVADPYAGKQDGEWKLTAVAMQGVYIKDQNKMYSVTRDEGGNPMAPSMNANDKNYYKTAYYVFDTTNVLPDDLQTYVVQTVDVKVMKPNDNGVLKAYNGRTFGKEIQKDADGNEIEVVSGTFMQEHTESGVVITITDWNGRDLRGTGAVSDVHLIWNYDAKNSQAYGGYVAVDENGATKDVSKYQQNWPIGDTEKVKDENGEVLYTKYIAADHIFQSAGTYQVKVGYKMPGISATAETITDNSLMNYTVYSKAPTVTISNVSTNPTTARYYKTEKPNSLDVVGGISNKKIDNYNAVVYMYVAAQSGTLDQEQVKIQYPTVTLSLSGVPTTHDGATMVFPSGNGKYSTFNFAAAKTTASAAIGAGTDGVFNEGIVGIGAHVETWPIFYPAGKQEVKTVDITFGGVKYTVTLANAVTINNPLLPAYADFKDIKSINSSFTGTTPSRIIGTPQADGTYTITLPGSQTWTEAKSTTKNEDFVVQSGYPQTATVYTTRSEGGGCSGTTYYYTPYTKTTTVSKASSSTTTWTRTWTITGWKIGNTTYAPGATDVQITGYQTITAVLSYSDSTKTTTGSTTMRTEYYYTKSGDEQTGNAPGTTIVDSETSYTQTNPYRKDEVTNTGS